MIDQLLLNMAQPMNTAYGHIPTWQNASKTAHVVHGLTMDAQSSLPVNTFFWLGTLDLKEWVLDDFNPLVEASPYIGLVHEESLKNVQELLPSIKQCLKELGWPNYYLCGHSKGAREAPIAHALMKEFGHPPVATRIYEPPRAGGQSLVDYLAPENIIGTQTWNTSGFDIVTLVPWGFGWENCCRLVQLNVPNSFGVHDKHVMDPGVLTGLGLENA